MPVGGPRLEAAAVPCQAYMGDDEETRGHPSVNPQVPSTLGSPFSFHLPDSSYECLMHYFQIFFFFFSFKWEGLEGMEQLHLGGTRSLLLQFLESEKLKIT